MILYLKSISLGRYLKIKKEEYIIYSTLYNRYGPIVTSKNWKIFYIILYFPSHTCALFLFHQRIIVGGRNKLFSGAQADQQTPHYFYSLYFFIKSNYCPPPLLFLLWCFISNPSPIIVCPCDALDT